ncbi:putative methyltransferase-domain-containing protein [Sporodiniella umbellata]|nr:putative methyltransferase-domain-containing protein [Sporodiniella umbellata]
MTPLMNDDEWEIELKPACSFQEGQLAKEPNPIPGFYRSGKGAFLFRVQPKHGQAKGGKRFLCIEPTSTVRIPNAIQPLTVGPIEIVCDLEKEDRDTSLPLELWKQPPLDMAYDGYRVFSRGQVAIHEMWDTGIPGKIWDSALVTLEVIKRVIQHHPEYVDSRHTVDLSAGTGLIGLYIASMMSQSKSNAIGKGKITITELDEALQLIEKNIEINNSLKKTSELSAKSLLWGNKENAETCSKADLIIASDVLYEAHFFKDLVKTFVDLSKDTTRIYIGYKRRGFNKEEEETFWSLCRSNGFQVTLLQLGGKQDIDDVLVPPMTTETGVQIYRLLRIQV